MNNHKSTWAVFSTMLAPYIDVSRDVSFLVLELASRSEPSASRVRAGIVLIQGPSRGKALDEGKTFEGLMI